MISSHREKDLAMLQWQAYSGRKGKAAILTRQYFELQGKAGWSERGEHGSHKRIHGADTSPAGAACGLSVWCSEVVWRTTLSAA